MFGTSFAQYERAFRAQLGDMFAPGGFDPRRDVAGIILNRWGHAYVSPQPGFFFGVDGKPTPRDVLRDRAFGRIAFANTELAGASDHRNAIREAERAVGQVGGGQRSETRFAGETPPFPRAFFHVPATRALRSFTLGSTGCLTVATGLGNLT